MFFSLEKSFVLDGRFLISHTLLYTDHPSVCGISDSVSVGVKKNKKFELFQGLGYRQREGVSDSCSWRRIWRRKRPSPNNRESFTNDRHKFWKKWSTNSLHRHSEKRLLCGCGGWKYKKTRTSTRQQASSGFVIFSELSEFQKSHIPYFINF